MRKNVLLSGLDSAGFAGVFWRAGGHKEVAEDAECPDGQSGGGRVCLVAPISLYGDTTGDAFTGRYQANQVADNWGGT